MLPGSCFMDMLVALLVINLIWGRRTLAVSFPLSVRHEPYAGTPKDSSSQQSSNHSTNDSTDIRGRLRFVCLFGLLTNSSLSRRPSIGSCDGHSRGCSCLSRERGIPCSICEEEYTITFTTAEIAGVLKADLPITAGHYPSPLSRVVSCALDVSIYPRDKSLSPTHSEMMRSLLPEPSSELDRLQHRLQVMCVKSIDRRSNMCRH